MTNRHDTAVASQDTPHGDTPAIIACYISITNPVALVHAETEFQRGGRAFVLSAHFQPLRHTVRALPSGLSA